MQHILSSCPDALNKNKWKHDQVLTVMSTAAKEAVAQANKEKRPVVRHIAFVPAGAQPKLQQKRDHGPNSLLQESQDWEYLVDLERALQFPSDVALTRLRLTVPW